MNPFKRTLTKTELNYCRFLVRNKLFENLSKKEMLHFIPILYSRNYRQQEVVFFRQDPSQALYLLKSGEVTLKLDIEDRFETISKVRPPASIGNNVLLYKSKRVYTAVVSSAECTLYVIPQVNLFNIFERMPTIKAKMLESLSEIYNEDFQTLFAAYQSTLGFFDLKEVLNDFKYGC